MKNKVIATYHGLDDASEKRMLSFASKLILLMMREKLPPNECYLTLVTIPRQQVRG